MTLYFKNVLAGLIAISLLTGCLNELEDNKDNSEAVVEDIVDGSKDESLCGPEHATAFSAQASGNSPMTVIRAADYGDGSHIEFIENGSVTQSGILASTETDYAVAGRGEYFYYMGRFGIDTFQKYYYASPESGLYQTQNNLGYSTREAGQDSSPNATMISFINSSTAILPRREENRAWVVNLDAQTESEFKICELDLSEYATTATSDGVTTTYPPHMYLVNINENYAAITMQRLEGYTPVKSAYVAIFDLNTWQEVDTNPAEDGLKGIELNLKNIQGSSLSGNDLYLSSLLYSDNSGGIEKVSLENMTASTINTEAGYSSVGVSNNGNIYAIRYNGWQDNGLYQINNNTSTEIDNTSGSYLTTLATNGNDLWLGFGLSGENQPKINVYNTINNVNIYTINGLLRSPVDITFIEK